MSKLPEEIIRDEIRVLSAYHVADPGSMIKLDAMENPYPLPFEIRRSLAAELAEAPLNRYPDAGARELKARLREVMGVPDSMDMVLGNGSDELIQMLALVVARPGASLLALEPSFVMFRLIGAFAGLRYQGVALNSDFTLNETAVIDAIGETQPALIFIAYPNNPSGNLFDEESMARIIDAAPGIVVVDEAYHAFAGRSFMSRLAEFPNLLVMRTLSKLGLAGIRLGLLVGRRDWLQHVDKTRLPYNVNVLTQQVASSVLKHHDVLESQARAICAERAAMTKALRAMPGILVFDSSANFILFRIGESNRVFDGLKQRGVLIKNLNGSHALLADCLRVTVGTPDENTRFLTALAAARST